jgi:hypothetical protein
MKLCVNILQDTTALKVSNLGGGWPHFLICEHFHAKMVGEEIKYEIGMLEEFSIIAKSSVYMRDRRLLQVSRPFHTCFEDSLVCYYFLMCHRRCRLDSCLFLHCS